MTRNDGDSADLRVKRTHKLLQEALIELTAQKGFSAVAVSDITKYAGVNRATFYRHYEDKFDLLNHYVRTVYALLDSMPDAGLPIPADVSARSAAPGLVAIFEHIRANARFYRVMLGPNGDPVFADKVRQYVKKRKISAGTRSDAGRRCRDTFLSLKTTCRKLGVTFWRYLRDRIRRLNEIPPLADLIRRKAAESTHA